MELKDEDKKILEEDFIKKNERFNIVSPDGKKTISVNEIDKQTALSEGWRLETNKETVERRLNKKIDEDPLSGVKAAGEGVVRGLVPFGQTIMEETGLVDETTSRLRQDKHSTISAIAEYGSMAASLLYGGGVKAGAGVLSKANKFTIPGMTQNIERAVEKSVSKIIPELTGSGKASKIANTILKSLPAGAGSAVGGAIYGAKEYIDEVEIGRADFLADSLISNIGMGGILGGALGSSFSVLAKGAGKVGEVAGKKWAGGIKESIYGKKGLDISPTLIKKIRKSGKENEFFEYIFEVKKRAPDLDPETLKKVADEVFTENGKLIRDIYNLADNMVENPIALTQKLQSKFLLNTIKSHVDQFGVTPAGANKLANAYYVMTGKTIPTKGFGKELGFLNSAVRKGSAKASTSKADEFIDIAIRPMIEKFEMFSNSQLKLKPLDSFWTAIKDIELDQKTWSGNILNKNQNLSKEVSRNFTTSARDVIKNEVKLIDKKLYSDLVEANSKYAVQGYARDALEDKIVKMSKQQAPTFFADLASSAYLLGQGLTGGFGMSTVANAIAIKQGVGLVRKIGDNPKIHNLKMQILEDNGKKFLQSIDNAVNSAMERGAKKSALRYSSIAAIDSFTNDHSKSKKESFEKMKKYMDDLSNPYKRTEKISQIAEQMEEFAPKTAEQIMVKANKALDFIEGKMPMNPEDRNILGAKGFWSPTDYELSKFSRYVNAVNNPSSVIKDISEGILSPEGIEVLQNVYPDMYQFVLEKFTVKLQDKNVPYKTRQIISAFFEMPLVKINLAVQLQENFLPKESPNVGTKPINIQSEETPIQRIMNK